MSFSKCQPGTEKIKRVCPGAKVRATVHWDGYKNTPVCVCFHAKYLANALVHPPHLFVLSVIFLLFVALFSLLYDLKLSKLSPHVALLF